MTGFKTASKVQSQFATFKAFVHLKKYPSRSIMYA
jgi:hypothetical protein